ncbi:MAG: leucine-rich repeat domain-containing protein [Ruminococcus sp.]|nr:leucine-rich repeat domain-containing protein [Ruminococcus sp.]
MSVYKKTIAFAVAVLMCFPASATVGSAFAEEDTETATEITTTEETIEETITEETDDGFLTSGDFLYSIIDDDSVCIEGCTSEETELVIPETIDGMTVSELSGTAFGNTPDRPYTSITIPQTVTYISKDNPFIYCIALQEVIVDTANENYISENGVIYTADKSLLVCYPLEKNETEFDIPEGVKEIGVAAVYGTKLTKINLPSTLETIERYSFGNNLNIKSIDMSNTAVEYIDFAGFVENTSLEEVIFSDKLTKIGDGAFMLCSSLEEINLPDGLTFIGQGAFIGTAMTQVEIPDSVTEIGYSAFGYEDESTPKSDFTIIASYGSAGHIYATDTDTEYDYKNDFDFITHEAFAEQAEYNSFEKSIYEDFEYTVIDDEAVITLCMSSDIKIEVPSEINGLPVTRIYTRAFEGSKAEEIIIPESVKTIDKLAFYNCASLHNLTINGAETIGESAFALCESLSDVVISGNLKSFGDDEPFISCTLLQSITITDGDGEYISENGILYSKDKSKLLLYPPLKTGKEFTVPSGVKEIGMSAFCNNAYIEKINLSGVETIGLYAFENSAKLKDVVLPKTLKTVLGYAFADCPSLMGIRVYENTDTIGNYAFGYRFDGSVDGSGNALYTDNMALVEGFKIYADKNTTAYNYGKACNIEVVSGTINIFGKNVVIGFLWAVGAIVGILVIGLIGVGVFRNSKNKKKKSPDKRKEKKNED